MVAESKSKARGRLRKYKVIFVDDNESRFVVHATYVSRPLASVVKVTGRDRVQFLQGMLSNDVAGPIPSNGLRAFHLDSKGSVLFPVTVSASSDSLFLDVEGISANDVITALDHFLVMERCALNDVLGGTPSYWLYGEITEIFDKAVITHHGNLIVIALGDERVYALPVFRWDGPCFVIWSDNAEIVTLLNRLGIVESSFDVAESARLRAGIPAGVKDFSRILAMESGITKETISFSKGCYIGQEVTARIDARGRTHRELVLLELADQVYATDVCVGDLIVGTIRSKAEIDDGRFAAVCYLRNDARTEPLKVGNTEVLSVRDVI